MPAPSYRLQNEQVGHLQALPGGLRVFYLDRCEYGMRLAHTSLSFALCIPRERSSSFWGHGNVSHREPSRAKDVKDLSIGGRRSEGGHRSDRSGVPARPPGAAVSPPPSRPTRSRPGRKPPRTSVTRHFSEDPKAVDTQRRRVKEKKKLWVHGL